jgi:hypothetical protein
MSAAQCGGRFRRETVTKFKLFVAAIAISTAFATPALAQSQSQEPWQSQEPGQFAAQYPNGDPAVALSGVRGAMAFVPMTKSAAAHDAARSGG